MLVLIFTACCLVSSFESTTNNNLVSVKTRKLKNLKHPSTDIVLTYDANIFNFGKVLMDEIYKEHASLDMLHMTAKQEYCIPQFHNDSDTEFHVAFYERMRQGWPEFLNM